jgi:hypothetical protein
VQWRELLTTNSWVDFGAPFLGSGNTNCVADGVTGPGRFYRLVVLP